MRNAAALAVLALLIGAALWFATSSSRELAPPRPESSQAPTPSTDLAIPDEASAPRIESARTEAPPLATLAPSSRTENEPTLRGLRGRVLDTAGRPLPGVTITAGTYTQKGPMQYEGFVEFEPGVREIESDPEGRFEGRFLDGDGSATDPGFVITVEKDAHLSGWIHTHPEPWIQGFHGVHRLEVGAEWIELDVALEASASIEGRVVDRGGQVLPGARVLATAPTGVGQRAPMLGGPHTDCLPDGSFLLSGLHPGEVYTLEVRVGENRLAWTTQLVEAPGKTELVVPAPCALEMEVILPVDSVLRRSKVSVEFEPVDGELEDNRVSFPPLPSGAWVTPKVGHSDRVGWVELAPILLTPGRMVVRREVPDAEPPSASRPLRSEATWVTLRLSDPQGALWTVDRLLGSTAFSRAVAEVSDASGESWLVALRCAGTGKDEFVVGAEIPSRDSLVARLVRPREGLWVEVGAEGGVVLPLDLDVFEEPLQTIRVRGQHADGRPAPLAGAGAFDPTGHRVASSDLQFGETPELSLPEGEYTLWARELGWRFAMEPFEVRPDGPSEFIAIFEEPHLVHGTVSGAGPGTALELRSPDHVDYRSRPIRLGMDGTYRVEAPWPGPWTLNAIAEMTEPSGVLVRSRSFEVTEPTTRVDVDLEAGLEGLVSLRIEAPETITTFRLIGSRGVVAERWRGLPGDLRFHLAPGDYEVLGTVVWKTLNDDLPTGEVVRRKVRLEPGPEFVLRFE